LFGGLIPDSSLFGKRRGAMAALRVSAVMINDEQVAGSAGPVFGAVSVTNENGVPVPGMSEDNFRFAVISTPQGVPEPLTIRLNTERGDGFYLASVFPRSGHITDRFEDAGDYMVGVQVHTSTDQGQTVAILHIPIGPSPVKPAKEALMSQLRGYEIVAVQKDATIKPGEILFVECPVPAGKILIGGGANVQDLPGSPALYTLTSSFPINIPGNQKWGAVWTNPTETNNPQVVAFTVTAICIDQN
jgi:hypothetical protein